MREIVYRAFWHKDSITTGVDTIEFLQGGTRVSDGCCHQGWAGVDCELRQFTDLLDKNGKEIYEGDIIKTRKSQHNPDNYQSQVDHIGVVEFSPTKGYYITGTSYSIDAICNEVIGNIFEKEEV